MLDVNLLEFDVPSQGCSKAAVGAITLDGLLRSLKYQDALKIPRDFARMFFKTQNDRIEGMW